ncbi:hypothetical protein [Shewanella algae]|uniref:hypothetical protein n=1 Tax=Shewanella algae TaxID=38313 RepID=UPI0031F54A0D
MLQHSPKIHRHLAPSFERQMIKLSLARRLDKAVSRYDFTRCPIYSSARLNGGELIRQVFSDGSKRVKSIPPRRIRPRREREETSRCLMRAMLYYVDYDPTAQYMFEVQLSLEQLAKEIGQLYEYQPGYDGDSGQYRYGRKSCDPVRGAFDDWELAKMVVMVREFDHETKTYKATRIFLTPLFFKALGFHRKDMLEWGNEIKRHWAKNGKPQRTKRRSISSRIANIDRASLVNHLSYMKRWFTCESNKNTANKSVSIRASSPMPISSLSIGKKRISDKARELSRELIEIKNSHPYYVINEVKKLLSEPDLKTLSDSALEDYVRTYKIACERALNNTKPTRPPKAKPPH